jgi:hypothetical protein
MSLKLFRRVAGNNPQHSIVLLSKGQDLGFPGEVPVVEQGSSKNPDRVPI